MKTIICVKDWVGGVCPINLRSIDKTMFFKIIDDAKLINMNPKCNKISYGAIFGKVDKFNYF